MMVLTLLWLAGAAPAQERPLVIPQVEGERQGRIFGRALACGVERARIDALIRRQRERMRAAVGNAFTEDRYLPALGQAIEFETSLPRPSEAACSKAFGALESADDAGPQGRNSTDGTREEH